MIGGGKRGEKEGKAHLARGAAHENVRTVRSEERVEHKKGVVDGGEQQILAIRTKLRRGPHKLCAAAADNRNRRCCKWPVLVVPHIEELHAALTRSHRKHRSSGVVRDCRASRDAKHALAGALAQVPHAHAAVERTAHESVFRRRHLQRNHAVSVPFEVAEIRVVVQRKVPQRLVPAVL